MTAMEDGTSIHLHLSPTRNGVFDYWDVVEELAAIAYERRTKMISTTQICDRLKAVQQESIDNIEEVREALVDLGYQVWTPGESSPDRSSLDRKAV
jgi:hypothetical protein